MTSSTVAPAVSAERLAEVLSAVRRERPLVHNITNYVVMNTTANALLAIGASPAMIHAIEEAAEFAAISRALVVNIGTLSDRWVASMREAADAAHRAGVPWVLDPVGMGATLYRSTVASELAHAHPAVIRGNASEIIGLGGAHGAAKGVDSTQGSSSAIDAARRLAHDLGTTVAVTGATDYVTDGERVVAIANGHPMMARVTGMGCTATALVGACIAVERDPVTATAAALVALGIAGEQAAARAAGPGSLQVGLLDALYSLDEATMVDLAKLS
jgi:hydroxyethylthiazole kinase